MCEHLDDEQSSSEEKHIVVHENHTKLISSLP
jgi:hypothetical protein